MVVEPLDVCEERVEVLVGELAPRSPEEGFAVDLRGRRSRRRGSVTRTSPSWIFSGRRPDLLTRIRFRPFQRKTFDKYNGFE